MADANITKKALASSFKELMEHEPFAKISVGEICAHCGMNRKSFYYHFEDKYSLVNWIFYTEFLETVLAIDELDSQDFLYFLIEHFYAERKFYKNALQIRGQNSLWEYFIEVLTPFLKALGDEQFEGVLDDFMVAFLLDGVLSALYRWLEEGSDITPAELVERLKKVYHGLAVRLVEQEKEAQ